MTRLIALTISLALNALFLGALDHSAFLASLPPNGEVTVMQLPTGSDVQTYASVGAAATR